MKKNIAFLLTVITIVSALVTSSSANSIEVIPLYNNVTGISTSFEITQDGTATVSVYYYGRAGIISSATITSKIQRKVANVWTDVKIAAPNNAWIDTSTSLTFSASHSKDLGARGSYRALVVYEISGTGGATDIITDTVEKNYLYAPQL